MNKSNKLPVKIVCQTCHQVLAYITKNANGFNLFIGCNRCKQLANIKIIKD